MRFFDDMDPEYKLVALGIVCAAVVLITLTICSAIVGHTL